ncbi:MAG TPA: DUF3618 domain-containing protein [Gemmataceae bacterium]|nr:DUF3618 domain-containing protein [Gemmataceae bacterium]
MDKEPDVIRQEIEQTRSSLTEKLETLESQVKETVQNVTSTVESTVESVKSKVEGTVDAVTSSVESTVESVKRTFDVERQVRQHPFAMTGGTMLVGLAAGYFLSSLRRPAMPRHWSAPRPAAVPERLSAGNGAPRPSEPERSAGGGLLSGLLEQFGPEIGKLKSTAIGMVLGAARDMIKEKLPPALARNVDELIDNVTRKAGGELIRGRVLPESEEAPGYRTAGTPTV